MEFRNGLGKRILLVDDDPDVRAALKMLLSMDEHCIVEAENGRQACFLFSPGDFDLVITDYEMPLMKGDELARTIKCLVPSQRIIMITGVPEKLCTENPVDAVMLKPVTLEELRQCFDMLGLGLTSARTPAPETQRHIPH
jgi:CheY-like chemotaxis protein